MAPAAKPNLDDQLDAMLRHPTGPVDDLAESIATRPPTTTPLANKLTGVAPASSRKADTLDDALDEMTAGRPPTPLGELDRSLADSAEEVLLRGDFQTVDDVLMEDGPDSAHEVEPADFPAPPTPSRTCPIIAVAEPVESPESPPPSEAMEHALDQVARPPAPPVIEEHRGAADPAPEIQPDAHPMIEGDALPPEALNDADPPADAPDDSARALAQELADDEAQKSNPRPPRSEPDPSNNDAPRTPRRPIARRALSAITRVLSVVLWPVVALLVVLNQPLAALSPRQRDVVGLVGVQTLCLGTTMIAWGLYGQTVGVVTLAAFVPLVALLVYLLLIR